MSSAHRFSNSLESMCLFCAAVFVPFRFAVGVVFASVFVVVDDVAAALLTLFCVFNLSSAAVGVLDIFSSCLLSFEVIVGVGVSGSASRPQHGHCVHGGGAWWTQPSGPPRS